MSTFLLLACSHALCFLAGMRFLTIRRAEKRWRAAEELEVVPGSPFGVRRRP